MKVLIVDDDPGALNALRVGLISCGFHVQTSPTGIHALELIADSLERRDPFHLLITDFRMPHMNGLELIQYARRLFPDLIALLTTGYGSEELRKDSDRIGVSGYLEKPFTPNILLKKVDELLQETLGGTRSAFRGPY